ncbi:nitroreductase family protein [Vibrio metschnikovii]|nr:nitroreductase family protein [Vibrio metschnikovii]
MIVNFVKKLAPEFILNLVRRCRLYFYLLRQYQYDLAVYHKYNSNAVKMNNSQIEGKIIAHYHVLEKGMSHPTPKSCFSLPLVENLVRLINIYDSKSSIRTRQVGVAVEVLKQYCKFSTNKGFIPQDLVNKIESLKKEENFDSGYLKFTREQFFEKSSATFECFSKTRYSVRDFTEEDVDLSLIQDAIRTSQKTPSVCNRQTVKVHILTQKDDIEKHLLLQNGNRGFGHKLNKLLIVTSDMYLFDGAKERNQAFTDGGMFAMSLLYALHNKKIGAVTLNWAYDCKQDIALHKLGIIPNNEKVILFIGVGYVPDVFKVAVSDRRNLSEIMNIV